MKQLLASIRACTLCEPHLPMGANPIISASTSANILIIGQAPGLAVHQSSVPWKDKSGDNLRLWLGIDHDTFYDPARIALMPMGFCYPGKGRAGDLPPRPECAPHWHHRLLSKMKHVRLTVLVGQYAQHYYLQHRQEDTLTETVRNFRAYLPAFFPVPHPSPRNNIWQAKNKWFGTQVLPTLRQMVHAGLAT